MGTQQPQKKYVEVTIYDDIGVGEFKMHTRTYGEPFTLPELIQIEHPTLKQEIIDKLFWLKSGWEKDTAEKILALLGISW